MVRTPKASFHIKQTISADVVKASVNQLSSYIQNTFDFKSGNVVLIGIQTRGYALAQRIATVIEKSIGNPVLLGAIDITLYRDDVRMTEFQPIVKETQIDFDIQNKTVVLVDDVLFTGRTIRAALDELMDFGRPKSVHLVVLVDRGHRELPIAAEFSAMKIDTAFEESVNLRLKEIDNEEDILITEVSA